MRDIIWTLIIIWLIYKIIGLFKGKEPGKTFVNHNAENKRQSQNTSTKDPLDKEGEYVDFEEIK
jgi:hypothetical protein